MANPNLQSVMKQQLAQAGSGEEWKLPANRRQYTERLEEALGGAASSAKARDIEIQIFNKAKSKEDYLGKMYKILMACQSGTATKKEGNANMQPGNQGHLQVKLPTIQTNVGTIYKLHLINTDPMTALHGLTSRGQNIGGQGGMTNTINMQPQDIALLRQQQLQQQQQQQMLQSKMASGQMTIGGINAAQTNMNIQQGVVFNHAMNQHQLINQQGNFVSPTGQSQQQMTQQRGMAPTGVYPGQPTPPQHQPGMAPSPVYHQQMSPAGLPQQNQPVPSPNYMHPAPSPQQMHSVPSPASNVQRIPSSPSQPLNTPGNPGSVGSNPGSVGPPSQGTVNQVQTQAQVDQVAYREKLRGLLKSTDLIQKQMQIFQEKGDKKKVGQLSSLLEWIKNLEKHMDMKRLLACERFVVHMLANEKNQQQVQSHPTGTNTSISQTVSFPKSSSKSNEIFQPLVDAIKDKIDDPLFNHHLQVSFGQALDTLHGKPSSYTAPVMKRVCADPEITSTIPDIVQGEVARLPPKFHVVLDPAHQEESKSVHLLCKLDDINLPSVPPICITVPEDYPKVNPHCEALAMSTQTPFFLAIRRYLHLHLKHLPSMFTITQILDAWEMSVRKSCLLISGS